MSDSWAMDLARDEDELNSGDLSSTNSTPRNDEMECIEQQTTIIDDGKRRRFYCELDEIHYAILLAFMSVYSVAICVIGTNFY